MPENISNIFIFFAGLGLFLMSFQLIVKHMQLLMGEKVRTKIRNAGNSKAKAVTLATGFTFLFQNSTAVLVLILGFAEMGMFSLVQSVPWIIGINIGSSCALLTTLLSSFSVSIYVSGLAFIGTFMVMFAKKEKFKNLGYVIFSVGVLFLGMHLMTQGMGFIKTEESILSLISSVSNPLILILIGFLLGLFLQSSLASNAIIITLCAVGAMNGLSIESALWLSFSAKIGPTLMGIFASLKSKKDSRAIAFLHFSINVLILLFFALTTLTGWHTALASVIGNPAVTIVVENIIVCTVCCLLLLPLSKPIAKVLSKIFKQKNNKYADFEIPDNVFEYTNATLERLNYQAKILNKELISHITLIYSSFFVKGGIEKFDEINALIQDFEFKRKLFLVNIQKTKVHQISVEEDKAICYLYNLDSRFESMAHRLEKLNILNKETNAGEIFTDEQEEKAKSLFEKILSLANMSSDILEIYLLGDSNQCYYLNNVIELDKEINIEKLAMKADIIKYYREVDTPIENVEKYARLVNESEQIGEHYTAISLDIL